MPKLKINDQEIEVAPGTSILQAAEMLGIEIPRFCYHDKLSVPANCRMCLVELQGAPKPVASCAMAAGDNMVVYTNTDKVKKARNGVMELILVNHPLDCPICDQGGECDLQDQAVAYGYDRSRYHEHKRAVPDKDLGPLIKTVMTRCINCTRCIRFVEEVAGVESLGQVYRGEDSEVGTFIGCAVDSELSGNLVDVCPVGALTNKPYAFKARPWELKKTETVDVHDALGANIRIDSRGAEVMRILPRLNEEINEEWIDDRSRYAVDGLKKNRLDRPYIRDEKTGKLREAGWDEALAVVAAKMKATSPDKMAAFAGDLADVESTLALKDLMTAAGCRNLECRVDGAMFDPSIKAGYVFNSTIAGIDQADAILLVGVNPRHEAAVLNARIRRNWQDRRISISMIGAKADLTYPYYHAGTSPKDLAKMVAEYAGKVQAKRPMIIVGAGAFRREDGMELHAMVRDAAEKLGCLADEWNGFNVLHTAAGRVGALELGFVPAKPFKTADMSFAYLLGVDNAETLSQISKNAFVVYQGHHGDAGAARADVILPGAAYTEKNAIYMNTEGRPQMARKAVDAPGEAREDWKILRALSGVLGTTLRYDDLAQLRARLVQEFPQFDLIDQVSVGSWDKFGSQGNVLPRDFNVTVEDFYLTNVIAKASPTLREASRVFTRGETAMAEAAE
jgi:NADH-quinone oxidoreductase subunit G